MSEKLKFGLIGSGSQGRYLCESLLMTDVAALVACADLDLEKARDAADFLGADQAYGSAEEMLAEADIEAVIVATIHDQLQPCAMQAVAAGKHALVEKPMALDAASGRELADAAKSAGVNVMVGYSLRFLPERVLMKQLLDRGAVGEMTHIIGGQLIGNMGGWLNERAHGGGPLLYVGSHALDTVLWVADRPVKRVYAAVEWKDGSDVEASADITIQFEGGLTALVSTSQRMGGRYGWLDVIGSAGRVRAQWESPGLFIESSALPEYSRPTTIEVSSPAGLLAPLQPEARGRMSGFKYLHTWATELTEFCNSITEGRAPSVSADDGVRTLEVIDAVFESAQTGGPVDL
jgi:predicted dehydrogenase